MSMLLCIVLVAVVVWVAATMAGGIAALFGALLAGAIAGWLAGILTRGRGFGIVRNILIGMIGSVIALLYAARRLLGQT